MFGLLGRGGSGKVEGIQVPGEERKPSRSSFYTIHGAVGIPKASTVGIRSEHVPVQHLVQSAVCLF